MRSQLVTRIKKLATRIGAVKAQHVRIENGNTVYLLDGTNRVYRPTLTGIDFHADSTSFVKYVRGPFGSGKSTLCLMDLLIYACEKVPPCLDGIRRMRTLLMRNTNAELESSTLESWVRWFEKLGDGEIERRKKPFIMLKHRFNDGRGLIEMELVFLPCDRPDQLKKLKSTEFTNAYLNEVSELPFGLLDIVKGRVGRFPARHMCPQLPQDFEGFILMDTNPPDTDHWLYHTFEEKCPSIYKQWAQPPGLLKEVAFDGSVKYQTNPNADNIQNLPHNYYLNMSQGATEEYIKVFCMGEYGILRTGKLVYPMYNDDIHSVNDIPYDPQEPLVYLGWDFGLTPAVLICQFIGGQLRCIKEFVSDNCSLVELVTYSVRPYFNAVLPGYQMISVCDPADKGSDADNVTCCQRLSELAFETQKAITNQLITRLDAVKNLLSRLVYGKPGIVVSRTGCPILRKGFLGDYHYKRVNVISEERYQEIPNKLHPVSDIHDGLQYIALQVIEDYGAPKKPMDLSQFIDNSFHI